MDAATDATIAAPLAPPRTKRSFRWLLAVPVVLLLVIVMAHLHRTPAAPTVSVQSKPVVETVVCSGRVLPRARVNLGPLARGIVHEVRVEEGQHVNAGDLLLVLDDAEARATLAQAQAGVSQAVARLAQLSHLNARLADEQLVRTDLELRKAEVDVERAQRLVAENALPRTQLEDAERALARAREQRNSAELQVQNTQAGGSEGKVNAASLAAAEGMKTAAETRLGYSRIVAPAAGVILTRSAEQGDIVEGGKVLLVLARDGEVRLLAQPDERALSHLAVGQSAQASAEAFPDRTFDAEVDWIAPAVDSSRGTVDMKLLVRSPPPYIRPEMTVSVNVITGRKDTALVLPPEAIRDAGGDKPWVRLRKGTTFERADVRLGLRSAKDVEVVSGLVLGDVVELPADAGKGTQQKIHPWD